MPVRLACWVLAVLAASFLSTGELKAMVKPDANAARAFGEQLKKEFRKKKSAAFIELIDGEAFNQRVFGMRDIEKAYPWFKWPKNAPPALTKTMAALDAYAYFSQYRVVLDQDVRTLDCDFLADSNEFNTARFFLVQNDAGEIRIADFQWGGDALTKSEILRHLFILEGVTMSRPRNEEEERLVALSGEYSADFGQVVSLFDKGEIEGSFGRLRSLPDEVGRTRICRHYLTCQIGASKPAAALLRRVIRSTPDQLDPILRFKIAMRDNDRTSALAAVDDVIQSQQAPQLFRCLKAGLLLEDGRAAQAYALARETIELEPQGGMGYYMAIRAAVALNRFPDAIDVMMAWCRILQPADVDRALDAVPTLKDFRASPEYSRWKEQAIPSAPPSLSPGKPPSTAS